MILMIIPIAGTSSKSREKWTRGTTPILRHCVSQPNLIEPMDIDENEENGQKRNCAPLPLF